MIRSALTSKNMFKLRMRSRKASIMDSTLKGYSESIKITETEHLLQ
jgi:hypothetical protein